MTSLALSTALDVMDSIHAMSIKLPPFYKEDPTGWYDQVKAQFSIRKITDDNTKYWHVRTSLDAETSCASHALRDEATSNCYARLRTFLVWIFSHSQHQCAKLPRKSKLGDHLPAQFANHLWQTLRDHDPSILLLKIF